MNSLSRTLLTTGTTIVRGLVELVYPNLCWHCREPIDVERRGFCEACAAKLFEDPFPACARCAATVGPHVVADRPCLACKDEGFAFTAVHRLGPYDGALREMIVRLKQGANEGLAELVAAEWVARARARLGGHGINGVVPVPLHWRRRWQRGYNQSGSLARAWADGLKVPCWPRGLRRIRSTRLQSGLPPTARRENVRGVFRASAGDGLKGKTVLLVDDVMTTGSTAHEAARMLRKAGALNVVVAVLARA